MGSFSDFLKEDNSVKSKIQEQNINDLIDKYSTYNEDDLMEEFLKEGKLKKDNGELDDNQLDKVRKILTPYLSAEQQEKLNNLLDMVK